MITSSDVKNQTTNINDRIDLINLLGNRVNGARERGEFPALFDMDMQSEAIPALKEFFKDDNSVM